MLVGHVKMRQGKTSLIVTALCTTKIEHTSAFGNVHINDNDTYKLIQTTSFTTPTPKRRYFRKK
jgi:hypothetical protein